jgi:hypothetical protein
MAELVAHAFDAAAWCFRRSRRDMNLPDVESLEEAEFFASRLCLLTDDDRAHYS